MMLYWEFLQVYIVIPKSIIVKDFRWVLWSKLFSRHVSFDRQAHAICVLFFKEEQVLWCYEGVKWLLLFNCTSIKQYVGYCMWCDPKSYSRFYVHFCVPWILEVFTNDHCAGTINDHICHLYQLSICVGTHSICRPWFSQGLCRLWGLAITSVDGCFLYIIIHNCILCGTWL